MTPADDGAGGVSGGSWSGAGRPPAGAFGRVLVAGEERHCRFTGDCVDLLDRPAYEAGAIITGEAAAVAAAPAAGVADAAAREPAAQADGPRLLAPVVPGKVVAVGLNYRAHADELRMETSAEPILFMKPRSALIGPGDTVVCPPRSMRVDYEAELALVVGRRCKDLSPAEARECVAGYTCGNDVTARDLQKVDGQWTRAKSFDTFCPLGPWIVPEAPSPAARVRALLDGAEVQTGLVGDMIVAPLELLAFVSGIMTLEPGDVIMTGTPPGVGRMRPGQIVTVEIDGIGRLTNEVGRR